MAAFERIQSGIPEMDQALDNIRLGDNVVWQVTNLEEFRYFVNPFVKQALADKRNLIYIRFASHEPFVEKQEGVKVYEVELSHKFETFTATIHHIIEREGYDAFYVFDCLSELQVAWSTDLMMGNFFKVTCPHHRNWVSRWRLRTSADFRRFLRWRTVRWDICRSFPTEAICFRIWWSPISSTEQCLRMRSGSYISRS